MADFTCPSLWIILSVCFLVSASEDIPTKLGENVTLPCRVPNNNLVLAIEWTRPNMSEEYVLFYRDGQYERENQHPSFKDRVELKDKQIKDGDVSVILKNVTRDDLGTYECYVFQSRTNRRKRNIFNTEPIKIITLTVKSGHKKDGGDKEGGDKEGGNKDGEKNDGNSRGYTGLKSAMLVSLCVIITVIISSAVAHRRFRRSKGDTKKNPLHPPTNEASKQLV